MKKKILISGSCSFIFSNFIRKAIYEKWNYEFIGIDKITNPSYFNNVYTNKDHAFYIGDIADQHFVDRIFEYEKPDIVINAAAETSVDFSLKEPSRFIHSNIVGAQTLINAALKFNVNKFFLISTDEVYGELKSEKDPSWTESSPLNPRNPYSASKASAELLVKAAHDTYGLDYIITRSCNNYGPRQTSDKLIPRAIRCILKNEKIPIYGKGLQIRDWISVFDNCAAIMKIIDVDKWNQIYNISANQEFSNIEVIQQICNTMGKGHDLISFVEDPRKAHDFRYSMDASKLRSIWEPKIKFKDGIRQAVEWYDLNQWLMK